MPRPNQYSFPVGVNLCMPKKHLIFLIDTNNYSTKTDKVKLKFVAGSGYIVGCLTWISLIEIMAGNASTPHAVFGRGKLSGQTL